MAKVNIKLYANIKKALKTDTLELKVSTIKEVIFKLQKLSSNKSLKKIPSLLS